MQNIATIHNIASVEYPVLLDLIHDIYCKEIPEVALGTPIDMQEVESLMVFFSSQYAYMIELWSAMVYHVRVLKRAKTDKEGIEDAMAKRDYLEKVMSACKLKHYACSRLLMYHGKEK